MITFAHPLLPFQSAKKKNRKVEEEEEEEEAPAIHDVAEKAAAAAAQAKATQNRLQKQQRKLERTLEEHAHAANELEQLQLQQAQELAELKKSHVGVMFVCALIYVHNCSSLKMLTQLKLISVQAFSVDSPVSITSLS